MTPDVARLFNRASGAYDAHAALQSEVRDNLLQRLTLTRLQPRVILDAGAGTGHASIALKRRYPDAKVFALDISAGMLTQAQRQQGLWRKFLRVRGDAQQLPFAAGSVDLVFSNLLLQCCDPDTVLREFQRVLRPGGLLSLTSLGPDTLRELRSAGAQVDAREHIQLFIDMHDLGDAIIRAGFTAPVLDTERYTLQYSNLTALLSDVRFIGANTRCESARRGLIGRSRLHALERAYEPLRSAGRLPASYEVVFANAWANAGRTLQGSDEANVSLAEVSAALRRAAKGSARPP